MKKTLKMMLAAVLSLAMLVCFVGAEDAVIDESVISVHAEGDALSDFTDAPDENSWKYDGLNCVAENGIMVGHSGLIRPDDSLTRAELVTMMVRVLGAEVFSGDLTKFVDMNENAWYYDSISSGVSINIINGSGNKMMPEAPITREQTFAILARTFLLMDKDGGSISSFNDASAVSAWAKNATNALIKAKVVLGDAKNTIRPQANVTRAEFAAMLDRIACYFVKSDVDYNGKTIDGSVIIRDSSVDLTGAVINGDIYITEAVGDDALDLSGVTVNGRIVVRSGNINVADGDKDKVVTSADMPPEQPPVVVPPVVDDGKNESDADDSPNTSSTPNKGNKTVVVDENETYVSWGDAETKEYAEVDGDLIVFDLSDIDANEELHNIFVKTNIKQAIKSQGFGEVSFMTNEEYPVADVLVDMLDSTSRSISDLLGITVDGNVTASLTVGSLADKIETAYTFYTNDVSEDKWLQKLFDDRGIICDVAANNAAFTGKIGTKEYTILIIVPELQ